MLRTLRSAITRFWMASIRRQLILGIALVHAILMTIFVVDLVDRQRSFLHQQSIAQADGLAKTLATSSGSWVLSRDIAGLEEILQSQAGFPDLRYAMVVDARGKVLAHTDKSKNNLYLVDKISRSLINSEASGQILLANNLLVDTAYPILMDDELIGWARVGIGQENVAAGLGRIENNGILYTLAAILVGSIFAYFMARSLTSGLQHLIRVAEGNRLGQRDLRVNLQRQDEIGLLGRDFNQMLDALDVQQARIVAQEAELKKIADVLPAPVARVDKDGRYLFVSAAYEHWFGKRPEDVIGRFQRESVSNEIYANVLPYFNRALQGENVMFEVAVNAPSGKLLHGQVTALPDYDADAKVCGFFVIVADITERKNAETAAQSLRDQLVQSTKMEAIGHLTAGIAHDFNNMLGAILGYTELANMDIAKNKKNELPRYLQEVDKAGQRAKQLVAQMLTFSRLTPHQAGKDIPAALVTPIIKEVFSLLRSSIATTIELNYQTGDSDLMAQIEPIQLHQIILNLCINARDAISEYGKIEITLARHSAHKQICASCKHPYDGEFIQITVRDTGAGIPENILANIFDPFFTTKGVGKGTGMGLSVVHGLVHSQGGHIGVESTPGQGTAIKILLPIGLNHAMADAHSSQPDTDQQSITGLRIMVVDDEDAMVELLDEYLSSHGAQVTSFTSSLLAWQGFERQPNLVDLVITDVTMPELSGMHLVERLLKLRPGLPVILCTGYSEHANPEIAEKAGAAGFFYKPLQMNQLLKTIHKVFSKSG